MARIPMTSGFALIPEGTYVFRIYEAKYDEEFGKIEIKLVNAAGMTHTERFSIKDKNDELNEKALNAFSYFAKTAMNDFSLEDVDPSELVDHFIDLRSDQFSCCSRCRCSFIRDIINQCRICLMSDTADNGGNTLADTASQCF